MSTRLLLSLAALALLALGGCSDSATDPAVHSGPGGNYQPGTPGSTWSYSGSQTYTITISGDTTINGKTYLIADNSAAGPGLVLVENGNYTQWPSLDLTEDAAPYLKESAPVGSSWSFAYGTSTIDVTFLAAGITHTVNGVTYSNVLKMRRSVKYGSTVINEGEYYYARDIGFIEGNFGSLGRLYLVSYDIK